MSVEDMVAEIDEHIVKLNAEIARYTAVRNLLRGELPEPPALTSPALPPPKRRGRPIGSGAKVPAAAGLLTKPAVRPRRSLSPEGRARIAAAMKERWASRRATAKKAAPKK